MLDQARPERGTLGMVLGKFMPPHIGHETLIRFGQAFCDRFVVQVCSTPREPIPGRLRHEWVREAFPGCIVVHNDDPNPQAPEECPDAFYDIWRESLLRRMERAPDYVFAGEEYGFPLAEALGAVYVPLRRSELPFEICATDIRRDAGRHWDAILPPARPFFLRRIAIVGPESVGKSTLAERLARHFGTVHVPEYGRTYTDAYGMELGTIDFERIAHGHRALEDALSRQARVLLVSDTEAVVTLMWARYLVGSVPPLVARYAAQPRYDLYLLSPPTEPWVQDGTRVQSDRSVRDWFYAGCRQELASRPCVELSGTWDARFHQALSAIEALLTKG